MGKFFSENKKHITFGVSVLVIFLVLKFVFPLLLPFLLAIVLVAAIYPAVNKIHDKIRIGKGFLAGIFLLLIFSALGGILWYLCTYGIHWVCEKIRKMDEYENQFVWLVETCSEKMEKNIGVKADQIQTIILERVDIFIEDMQVKLLPEIMNQSFLYVKVFIGVVTFLVVMIIAAILIIKDYDVMKEKASQIKQYEEVVTLLKKMGNLLLSFFKAQAIILAVVSVICMAGFYFVGVKPFVLVGILTGILDVLPFVGTGITLLPFMFWKYINGEIVGGTILLVTFLVSAIARELLEPKLIGKRMNILPILILVSVYAGVQVFGLLGVFLGPFFIMLVQECYSRIYQKNETMPDRQI